MSLDMNATHYATWPNWIAKKGKVMEANLNPLHNAKLSLVNF
jgi:hypothetical protein